MVRRCGHFASIIHNYALHAIDLEIIVDPARNIALKEDLFPEIFQTQQKSESVLFGSKEKMAPQKWPLENETFI